MLTMISAKRVNEYKISSTQDQTLSADMYEGIPLGDINCNIGRIARHERQNGRLNSPEDAAYEPGEVCCLHAFDS